MTKKMNIYEPAMCCDTGCCGPKIDPELLRITATLAALRQKGVEVGRFNLANSPMAFIESEVVAARLRENGTDILPCATVDGKIVIEGRYPTADEFMTCLGVSEADLHAEETNACCCAPSADTSNTSASGCGCDGGCC
ncbi:MAG: arsenite efflux transporter metallochaperone ArsD [Selenomonadaceae bacterium]